MSRIEGWIKLHRSLRSHWVLTDAEALSLWIYFLLEAAYEPKRVVILGKLIDLLPGQVIFRGPQLQDRLNIDINKIYRTLKIFEGQGMISVYSNGRRYSVVTVNNWDAYQGGNLPIENNRETKEKLESIENKVFEPCGTVQSEKQKRNKRETIYKNNKNIKNQINLLCPDESVSEELQEPEEDVFTAFWAAYPRKIEKAKARKAWEARLKEKVLPADMIQAAENYSAYCARLKTEPQYIKHPSTFLGKDKPFMEYIQGMPEVAGSSVKTDTSKVTNRNNFQSRNYDDQFFEKLGKMGS